MAEAIAVYSPPMPAPVTKRNRAKLAKSQGECGRGGGDEVDAKRNEEQALATEPIGQPAEQERSEHCAGEIEAAG
jgi:hypothetical protein